MRISVEHVLGMLAARATLPKRFFKIIRSWRLRKFKRACSSPYRSMGGEHVHKHMAVQLDEMKFLLDA